MTFRPRLLYRLTALLLTIALATSGSAQDLRYELGARLRLFERDFEHCKTPEERSKALDHLNKSVQQFFGLKMLSAVQELDAARVAIQPDGRRSVLEKASNVRLTLSTRIIEDPATQNLEGTFSALYGDANWSQLDWSWQVQQSDLSEAKTAGQKSNWLRSGEFSMPDSSEGRLSVPLESLPDGDYLLILLARDQSSDEQVETSNGSGTVVLETMFSISHNANSRLKRLSEEIAGLSPELDSTQVASLKNHTKIVQRIWEGGTLETNFPVNRMLCQSEQAIRKLVNGTKAYGDGQAGEFWLVTSTPSGQKWLRLMAPDAVSDRQPLPLVVALHGAGGSENMFFDTYGAGKIVGLAEDRQWLLVAPRIALGGLHLDDLVDSINELYPVDRQSIFIVGHSMGAAAAVAMTQNSMGKPTAVAALGGGRPVSDAGPFQGIPMWVAAGSHDFGRSGAKKLVESLERNEPACEYHEYENVEHLAIVQVALEDVFQFFDKCHSRRSSTRSSPQPDLRINHLQLVGTHNSYHLAPDPFAMKTIAAVVPREAKSLDNSQRPLYEQFQELGVRHVELDIYRDPEGELFKNPFAYVQAKKQNIQVPLFDPNQKMAGRGMKVLHSPDFDFRTTVLTLQDALQEIKSWSDANRRHVPVFILLELKSDSFSPMTRPLKWSLESFEELEGEILAVFPRDRILAPDDVRGSAASLKLAVEGIGWPTVDSQRGKVAFLLDNEGVLAELYLTRSPILQGCLLFTSVSRDHPAAAWFKKNDPIGSFDEISELVRSGFLVRTRADVGTVESRNNDPTRRDKAIASGAQLISTDYPEPDSRFSDYCVTLPLPNEAGED